MSGYEYYNGIDEEDADKRVITDALLDFAAWITDNGVRQYIAEMSCGEDLVDLTQSFCDGQNEPKKPIKKRKN